MKRYRDVKLNTDAILAAKLAVKKAEEEQEVGVTEATDGEEVEISEMTEEVVEATETTDEAVTSDVEE